MIASNTDRIHKEVSLRTPQSRVWQAITDSSEFGEWFGVHLKGPFRVGETIRGQITYPGYEHLEFVASVERVDAEQSFSFRWCPYAMDPNVDYSGEPTTLVEFRLEKADNGTTLTITESGFDAIPEKYRKESFVRNEGGWNGQVENIKKHVDG